VRDRIASPPTEYWWKHDEETAHDAIFEYVEALDEERIPELERWLSHAKMYDQRGDMFLTRNSREISDGYGTTNENVIKSTVNTACSIIGKNRPRAAFMTDGADWSVQRRAKMLEKYVEALFHKDSVYETAADIFRDACVAGTGIGKIVESEGYPSLERVQFDEILVDEYECRTGKPRQLHQRRFVDRDVFMAWCDDNGLMDDDLHAALALADTDTPHSVWAKHHQLDTNQIVVVESWSLPYGKKSPGRHAISIRGKTVLWEKYKENHFPFVFFHWSNPLAGFWGLSLVEEIASIQLRINKMNRFIDKAHDLVSVPRVAVHISDANLQTKLNRTVGQIIPYRSKPPQWMVPPAVSGEYYARLDRLRQSAYEMCGVSMSQAQAKKPAGLESAVAIREYNDINTERFAIQAQNYEAFFLEIAYRFVKKARDLHSSNNSVEVLWRSKNLAKRIKWEDVDMDDDIFQMSVEAASLLSRTPAGRQQAVVEMMQAGLVSVAEGRRLMGHPDLQANEDLATAAIEDIHASIEHHLDDLEFQPPEQYQDLKLGIKLYQMECLKARRDGAPEHIQEKLHTWIAQAQSMLDQAEMAARQAANPAGAQPPMGGPPQGNDMGTPAPAMSPQAMQIMPSYAGG
jgi:hypothetical protein